MNRDDDFDRLIERLTRQALTDRMEAMQRLTAGLAHELRNPVNAARLQLKLLERRLPPSANGMSPTAAVFEELEAITALLEDFLLFARPSPLAREDHEIVQLVRGAVADEGPYATSSALELRFTTNVERATFPADGGKLAFVVTELVRNAIEAGLPGGHVDIEVDVRGDRLRIEVRDDGAGIAPELRTRIYEPFFSTRDRGRGLGLAIVHTFVTMHRGTIDLTSPSGETCFAVTIPHPEQEGNPT